MQAIEIHEEIKDSQVIIGIAKYLYAKLSNNQGYKAKGYLAQN
jgi:hypothetical protein